MSVLHPNAELIEARAEIDRLRAENAEKLKTAQLREQALDKLRAENESLRAELEALKQADANKDWLALVAECRRLRAENEALNDRCGKLEEELYAYW